ncbi:MAG TPA: hypothetical protein P5526_07315 [Anaerolineae bacterium]|nr:hypothetical protein [Anaerolineae bacterium]
MTNITLSIPPELARELPSDPESLAQVLALGLKQWQVSQSVDVDLTKLQQVYKLRQPDETQRFLKAFPDLVEALEAAYPPLQNLFGDAVPVHLEVLHDPEVEEWHTLTAYILTSLPINEALNRLARFDETWLVHQPETIQDHLSFSLEFV